MPSVINNIQILARQILRAEQNVRSAAPVDGMIKSPAQKSTVVDSIVVTSSAHPALRSIISRLLALLADAAEERQLMAVRADAVADTPALRAPSRRRPPASQYQLDSPYWALAMEGEPQRPASSICRGGLAHLDPANKAFHSLGSGTSAAAALLKRCATCWGQSSTTTRFFLSVMLIQCQEM